MAETYCSISFVLQGSSLGRHSRAGRNPGGCKTDWTPAFAGVTLLTQSKHLDRALPSFNLGRIALFNQGFDKKTSKQSISGCSGQSLQVPEVIQQGFAKRRQLRTATVNAAGSLPQ